MPVATARIFGLSEPASRLTLAALVIAGAIVALVVLRWVVPRLSRVPIDRGDPARVRQRQTAVALLGTALRYLVVVAAVVAVLVVLAGGGGLGALGGSALIVAIVGFASQRLLGDAIAGFFILFENQYGVGDFVRLEPSGHTGVVVELGLRTTVLKDLNGDRCFIPNGSITAVRRTTGGRRRFAIDVTTADPEALALLVADLARGLPAEMMAEGPAETARLPAGEGLVRVRLEVVTPPSLEPAAREWLLAALRARGGGIVVGEPFVTALDPSAMARYERSLAGS